MVREAALHRAAVHSSRLWHLSSRAPRASVPTVHLTPTAPHNSYKLYSRAYGSLAEHTPRRCTQSTAPSHSRAAFATAAAAADAPAPIVEVDSSSFQREVVQSAVPVLLDCYATWCDPCKQLTPLLEKIVLASQGKLRLAKLDVDRNPEMAEQIQVKSLPTVLSVVNGKVVDHFQGVLPPDQLKAYIEKTMALHVPPEPQKTSVESALAEATALAAQGRVDEAETLLEGVLQHQDATAADKARATAALIGCALGDGRLEVAQGLATELRKAATSDLLDDPAIRAVLAAVDMAALKTGEGVGDAELRKRLDADKLDNEARYTLACRLAAAGLHDDAIKEALLLVRYGKDYEDGAGVKLLLQIFDVLGDADPLVKDARKRLSNLMFV